METHPLTPEDVFGKDVHYSIPDWQRRYKWEKDEQWLPFWEDVRSVAERRLAGANTAVHPHFLGAVVLKKLTNMATEPPRYDVIDGQQRLATLQLLIRAVERECSARNYGAAVFFTPLLKNREQFAMAGAEFSNKMTLKQHDRDDFVQVMQSSDVDNLEESLVEMAFTFFRTEVSRWLDMAVPDKREQRADALLWVLKSGLTIVVIETATQDDANLIFETLNARGTPLLAWDMVRNAAVERLPHNSDVDLQQFDDDWWQEEVGRGTNRRARIDNLLIEWLTMRMWDLVLSERGAMDIRGTRKAFEAYRQFLMRQDGAVEATAKDFVAASHQWRRIQELGDSSIVGSFLERWRLVPHGSFGPVILWLLVELDEDDDSDRLQRDDALRAIETYFVRRMLSGDATKGGGGDITGLMRGIFSSLPAWRGQGAVGSEVSRYFASLSDDETTERLACPSNDRMVRALTEEVPTYSKLNQGQARMVLMAIEEYLRGNKSEGTVPSGLTIEHLMPQAWSPSDYPHPSANIARSPKAQERRATLINTVGNLTLVTREMNGTLSNGPWPAKRKKLEEYTTLLMNTHLLKSSRVDKWDEDDIVRRSEELAEIVCEIWPSPS